MVEIYNHRIEFTNPGESLVDPLRLIGPTPKSRNEDIAHLMRRMNICEERGSGIIKIISAVESYQLPAPKFIKEEQFFRAILYSSKIMTLEDKIRACYQHCCLQYASSNVMTNASLRKRFKIEDKNYPIASKVISDTINSDLIKRSDLLSQSNRTAQYIPFWA